MKVPLVDLQAQHRPIRQELNEAIGGVVDSGHFVLGEEVERFEEEFAAYCGTRFGVGVDSGLSALELTLRALDIGPGDEVIVPTLTFIATAASVSFTGAEPVFVDVNPVTYCIDSQLVEAAITPRTRAIIPVHLYGFPANMDRLVRIARRNNLKVIEDAAQAHGARYKGRRTGSLGHAAAFSFYPSKNLGAFGDGGIVVTDDARIAERVRTMRNCGQKHRNRHEMAPFNHRLDSIQAAVLRVKLRYLDQWNEERRSVAEQYNDLLEGSDLVPPLSTIDREHVYHLYVVRSLGRDKLQARLDRSGIGTAIHYPTPVHLQPFYAYQGHRRGQFPIAEQVCREILSLPMFPGMSTLQTHLVASNVEESFVNRPIFDPGKTTHVEPGRDREPEPRRENGNAKHLLSDQGREADILGSTNEDVGLPTTKSE